MKYNDKNPDLLEGEPWFLIRGRDMFAVDAIQAYADLAAEKSRSLEPMDKTGISLMQHALEIIKIKELFMNWQERNRDKVRAPKPEPRND